MNSTGKMERLRKTVSSSKGMASRINLVVLQGSSFTEIGSMGAEHWYGRLIGYEGNERKELELRRKLTDRKEVEYLNAKDGVSGLSAWKLGHETMRFPSREALVTYACKTWRKAFSRADALIKGRVASCEPQEPLAARDPDILEILKEFWETRKKLGGYEHNPTAMRTLLRIYDKWISGKP